MPEGDSVHRAAKHLHAALAGEDLIASDFRVPAYATVDLSGRRIDEVVSRGKHLLIRVGNATIHSHLKMEGRWDVYAPQQRWRAPGWQARVVLRTNQHVAVGFQLGRLDVVPRSEENRVVGHLGPDLLGADWDATIATANIEREPGRTIGTALLDQRNLAGIGNVYRSEVCFLTGILPTRAVVEVPDVRRLVDLSHDLLGANKDRDRRITTGDPREPLWVYGRRGPCLRCGTAIERGQDADTSGPERVVYWCPRCQT
jgi:endonuclease-8